MLPGFLQQQTGVVEQLRSALSGFDQLGLQVESFVQILAFDGQRGQAAQRVDGGGIRFEYRFERLGGAILIAHVPIRQAEIQLRLRPSATACARKSGTLPPAPR